mgnify:CR=1 FL=1
MFHSDPFTVPLIARQENFTGIKPGVLAWLESFKHGKNLKKWLTAFEETVKPNLEKTFYS